VYKWSYALYGVADVDECAATVSPCVNALACTNRAGGYDCSCQKGWEGHHCDININDCVGQCLNGATCIDLVNDYHCACQPGFTGEIFLIYMDFMENVVEFV
jgi:jagged-like protein